MEIIVFIALFPLLVGGIYVFSVLTIDGNYLKILDKNSEICLGTLIDYQGTATTSDGGQTVILFVQIAIDGENKIVNIREHHDIIYISKLFIGMPLTIRYSPKYDKAKTIMSLRLK